MHRSLGKGELLVSWRPCPMFQQAKITLGRDGQTNCRRSTTCPDLDGNIQWGITIIRMAGSRVSGILVPKHALPLLLVRDPPAGLQASRWTIVAKAAQVRYRGSDEKIGVAVFHAPHSVRSAEITLAWKRES